MKDLGLWVHDITGEIYEIRQRGKEIVMQCRDANICKPLEPFSLLPNWNKFDLFKRL